MVTASSIDLREVSRKSTCASLRRPTTESAIDVQAVVEIYEPYGLEVELVRADGRTRALVEVSTRDVRSINGEDLIANSGRTRSAIPNGPDR